MRIAVVSTQCNGKTTLVEALKHQWPNYTIATTSDYRQLIKDKNLPINEGASIEGQRIIRDALSDQAIQYASDTHVIHDRCILDNTVYSIYLAEKGKITDSDFVADSINICRESMKMFDIIFWLQLNPNIKLTNDGKSDRSVNAEFRTEIDAIFHGVYQSFRHSEGIMFPLEDSPTMIMLEGDLSQKLKTIGEYLDHTGELVEIEESAMAELQSQFEKENFLDEVRTGKA